MIGHHCLGATYSTLSSTAYADRDHQTAVEGSAGWEAWRALTCRPWLVASVRAGGHDRLAFRACGRDDECVSLPVRRPRLGTSRKGRLALTVTFIVLVMVVSAVLLANRLWFVVTDPAAAACATPPVVLGAERDQVDHRELDVVFTCEGARMAGTIYLPSGPGPHPAVVWVHGAGDAERLGWGGQLLPGLVRAGVAVLSYDKRGAGQSEGRCCPGDEGHFNLLTADVEGAVEVLRAQPAIDPNGVGLVGASQAGWIAPRAADVTHAAFVALASAPTVPERTANLYERLAAGEEGVLSRDEITRRLRDAGPSGYDPLPDLEHMTMPGLWLFGSADQATPVEESVAVLDRLKTEGHNITVHVFPGAGHGLLDLPPTAPEAPTTLITWIQDHVTK